jgi:hypothetical protein
MGTKISNLSEIRAFVETKSKVDEGTPSRMIPFCRVTPLLLV